MTRGMRRGGAAARRLTLTLALMLGMVGGAATMGAPTPAQAAEPGRKLRAAHFLPPGSTTHAQVLKPWTEAVTARSGGKLAFDLYPSMQLGGKPAQLLDQLRDGVADVIWTLPGYTRGRFPLTEAFELPFVAGSAQATSRALMALFDVRLAEEYRDVKVLALHAHAPGALMLAAKPVARLEDFKGLKIRAPHYAMTETLKAFGAAPTSLPIGDTYDGLHKRVIDGAMAPFEVGQSLRLHEAAKYYTEARLYTAVFLFAMNKRVYEALDPDLKAAVDGESGPALAQKLGRLWDAREAEGRALAVAAGGQFVTPDPAELARWRTAAEPVIQDWTARVAAKGSDAVGLLSEARALIARFDAEAPRP